MHDVNWWLMALAFVLGLVLTWAFTIRRVKREVPVSVERTRQGFAGRDVGVRGPDVDVKPAGAAGAAGVGAVAAASFAGRKPSAAEPYGAGPVRAGAGGSGPAGYTVKGNEDSMLYHTPDSPSYKQTIAEVWFRDEESAVRGGFTRWDAKRHDEPYRAGPVRAGAGGSGPAGYTVKGNEDSMLYHTPDSPSYKQTIAEVWFRDEESAVRGGFTRWDRGRRN